MIISIRQLDKNFFLRFNKKFVSDIIDTKNNLEEILSTPKSNLRRIKQTGVIKLEHFVKLMELGKINESEACEHLIGLKSGDRGTEVRITLPINCDSHIAALIGHVMGDGTIHSDGSFEYTNKDYILIRKIKHYMKISFGCEDFRERIEERPTGQIFKIIYPSVIGRLLKIFGAPQGKKVDQVFDVPEWIKNGNHEIKSEFLKALFDDDGSVETKNILSFTNSKRKELRKYHEIYINSISKILNEFEINTQIRFVDRDSNFKADIRITNLTNFEKFKKSIGFTQVKRKQRLDTALLNPTRKYNKLGEGKRIIHKILENSNKALTTEEISELIKRNLSMTRNYLFRLEKENLVERAYPQRHKVKTMWKIKGRECIVPHGDSLYSICDILSKEPSTAEEITKKLDRQVTTIRKNLRFLKSHKKIKSTKSGRSTVWQIA
jgi:predicted transcriptional regulator